jgi:hypothetical protein
MNPVPEATRIPPEPQEEPPPPVLPPPEEPEGVDKETDSSADESNTTPTEPKNPRKNGLCEYMKVVDPNGGGVPTFASASKGQVIEYLREGDLAYRHLSQIGVDGEAMMYISIQSGETANRVRWVQAKFLQERNPDSPYCNP